MAIGLQFWIDMKKKSSWFLILWGFDIKITPQHGDWKGVGKGEVLGPRPKMRGDSEFLLALKYSYLGVGWQNPALRDQFLLQKSCKS